jgi:cardiolipin synthase A/B
VHTLLQVVSGLGWELSAWTALLVAAELFALVTLPSVLLSRRGQPLAALSWTLTLVAAPFLGVLAWWLFGRIHLKRKRLRRNRAHWEVRRGFAYLRPETPALPAEVGEVFNAIQRLPEEEAGGLFAPVAGNRVTVLRDGCETYAALERVIAGAEHHLHLLFYTFEPDATGRRFRDLLAERARSGIRVRLLLDAMGSFRTRSSFLRPIEAAGGEVAFFAPVRFLRRSLSLNFRNHRKILVADGHTAYTGGLNIGDAYLQDWRDGGLLLEGPVASQLQEVFLDDWFFATGRNLADRDHLRWCEAPDSGPGGDGAVCAVVAGGPDSQHNLTHDAFFLALTQARERIWITTPYFIPDPAIQAALRTAVYKGVDVRLLVPRRSDLPWTRLAGRSYFPDLLQSGARIWEYLPTVLHGKTWIFDRDFCAAGSANLDTRSFKLNFEVTCFIREAAANARMAQLFEQDLAQSAEVTLASLARASAGQRLLESALNLFSPLL